MAMLRTATPDSVSSRMASSGWSVSNRSIPSCMCDPKSEMPRPATRARALTSPSGGGDSNSARTSTRPAWA